MVLDVDRQFSDVVAVSTPAVARIKAEKDAALAEKARKTINEADKTKDGTRQKLGPAILQLLEQSRRCRPRATSTPPRWKLWLLLPRRTLPP